MVMNNIPDIFYIESTAGKVSRYKHFSCAIPEFCEGNFSISLFHASMIEYIYNAFIWKKFTGAFYRIPVVTKNDRSCFIGKTQEIK